MQVDVHYGDGIERITGKMCSGNEQTNKRAIDARRKETKACAQEKLDDARGECRPLMNSRRHRRAQYWSACVDATVTKRVSESLHPCIETRLNFSTAARQKQVSQGGSKKLGILSLCRRRQRLPRHSLRKWSAPLQLINAALSHAERKRERNSRNRAHLIKY